MNRRIAAVVAAVLGLCLIAEVPARCQMRIEAIYGKDDRVDLYQVRDPRLRRLSDSTAAFFQSAAVRVKGNTAQLALDTYGTSFGLCKDEPFYSQPSGAFCTGSLVAPNVILTAGHCVHTGADCRDARIVFGFSVSREGQYPTAVPASDVYQCVKILSVRKEEEGEDWGLIELDRPVEGRQPLKVNESGAIKKGAPLVLMGYPSGLPLKVAAGASVKRVSKEGYFVADVDSYAGNSGSPVFNAETGLIEGVLVRGGEDFEDAGGCMKSKVYKPGDGGGEEVTRISAILPDLPSSAPARMLANWKPGTSFGELQRQAATEQ
ncbi:MAG: serine protease [Elusimicrobia bacterium]|nr:serine protease [Elusimicrobiota bacterium]